MNFHKQGIQITKTTESDLPEIFKAGLQEPFITSSPFGWSAELLADSFISDSSILFSARRKKQILGFIIGSIEKTDARIKWFMVNSKFRKMGIGRELLEIFMKTAKNNGADNFFIALFEDTFETVNFFNNQKFFRGKIIIDLTRKN